MRIKIHWIGLVCVDWLGMCVCVCTISVYLRIIAQLGKGISRVKLNIGELHTPFSWKGPNNRQFKTCFVVCVRARLPRFWNFNNWLVAVMGVFNISEVFSKAQWHDHIKMSAFCQRSLFVVLINRPLPLPPDYLLTEPRNVYGECLISDVHWMLLWQTFFSKEWSFFFLLSIVTVLSFEYTGWRGPG
jgi:hypothetical protein